MFFYLPEPLKLHIDSNLSGHFFSMRVNFGDVLKTTDLKCDLTEIKVTSIDKKNRSLGFDILKQEKLVKPSSRILFQAIIDKLYLEKLVEIAPLAGITKIYFFESNNSVLNKVSLDRLEKILIRSCEQSEQYFKTELEFIDNDNFLKQIEINKPIVLDLPQTSQNSQIDLKATNSIIVGPEGGFTDQERLSFKGLELDVISLGETVFPAWMAGFVYFTRN
ncbi:MAG: RsmE family RNA methyltransferase [bacterium]